MEFKKKLLNLNIIFLRISEPRIYKIKQESIRKKERKHALDRETDQENDINVAFLV